MTCRATRREHVLVSRSVHPHYRRDLRDLFRGCEPDLRRGPAGRDGPAAGTTDLAALERMLADPERPVAGVVAAQPSVLGLLEPMEEIGRLAHAAGALFVAVVEPVSLAVLAPAGGLRGRHRGRRRPAARDAAAVRRPLPRDPRLPRVAHPADSRPPDRDDRRRRRPARLRHDHARPRAGHPPRASRQQHLHQPGPLRARRLDLPGGAGPGRPPRRGGDRVRPGPRSSRRPSRRRAPRASTRDPTSPSSPSASRTPSRSTGGCWRAGSWPGIPLAELEPGDPALAEGLLVCATEVTTPDRDRALRRGACRRARVGRAPGPRRRSDERHRRSTPADALRAQPARPRRRHAPARRARRRPRADPGGGAAVRARRRSPSSTRRRLSATT